VTAINPDSITLCQYLYFCVVFARFSLHLGLSICNCKLFFCVQLVCGSLQPFSRCAKPEFWLALAVTLRTLYTEWNLIHFKCFPPMHSFQS